MIVILWYKNWFQEDTLCDYKFVQSTSIVPVLGSPKLKNAKCHIITNEITIVVTISESLETI